MKIPDRKHRKSRERFTQNASERSGKDLNRIADPNGSASNMEQYNNICYITVVMKGNYAKTDKAHSG